MIWGLSGYFRDVLDDASDGLAYGTAVAAAVLFFVSLTLHELGHALVARRNGIGISGIELWFFGGLAKMTRDTNSPGEEFRVSAAGPAVTLLIVIVCSALGAALTGATTFREVAELGNAVTDPAVALLGWLAFVNATLLIFNLVPAFPLDGGRIARAIAWKVTGDRGRGTRFSAALGQIFSYLLVGLGIFLLVRSDPFTGIWFILLGWFLGSAARGAAVQSRFTDRLEGVTAGDLMDEQPVWVPADTTAVAAQDEFFERYRWPWLPVADPATGRFRGLLGADQVDAAVTGGRPRGPAGALARREDAGADGAHMAVRADTPVEELLGAPGLRERGALMVVDGEDRLCGVVTVDQVRRALTQAAARPA